MMDILLLNRIIALFTLFVLTLAAGLGPIIVFRLWNKRKQSNRANIGTKSKSAKDLSSSSSSPSSSYSSATILQVFMFFGGGVLLATCFVHLIPETNENFEKYQHANENKTSPTPKPHHGDHNHRHKIPWIELSICGGFFLIYFLEETLFHFVGHDHHDHSKSAAERPIFGPSQCDCIQSTSPQQGTNYGSVDTSIVPHVDGGGGGVNHDKQTSTKVDNYHHENVHISSQQTLTTNISSDIILPKSIFGVSQLNWAKFFHGLLTIMAFSVHSIFDGITIGLQETRREIWTVFLAIFFHKMVVAFAIGLDLYEKTSHLVITTIHMIFFSLMSPFGILLVILTSNNVSNEPNIFMIILSAICTGTIIYIVFFEILQRERVATVSGLAQFFIVLSGFMLMTCITLFISE